MKLKEKLGLCLYEVICDEQELISMSEEIFKQENIFTQHDVENNPLKEENEKLRQEENDKLGREENDKLRKEENEKLRKEENEKLRKENKQLRKENEQLRKNNVVKDGTIKKSIKKLIEIRSPKENKNTTYYYPNWFDKNKFKKVFSYYWQQQI